MKSSLSSCRIRVVESRGVGRGTGGGVYEMMGEALVVMLGIDGKMTEDVAEVSFLDLLDADAARYLPLGSLHVVFTSIADVVLATRWSMKHSMRWSGGCMPCQLRLSIPR
jgi:hypothetical protein